MSLILQGSTSGSVTLQEPAVAGTTVLDLPATSGTVLVGGTQNIPKSALPTGSVLQVVQGSTSTQTSTTSQSYSDTTLTASITPTSATSKILVLVNQSYRTSASQNNTFGGFRLLRGATAIWTPVTDSNGPYSHGISAAGATFTQIYTTWSIQVLDSPATTSSTTYKTQFAVYTTASTLITQLNDTISSNSSYITLMEIAA